MTRLRTWSSGSVREDDDAVGAHRYEIKGWEEKYAAWEKKISGVETEQSPAIRGAWGVFRL